MKLFYYQRSDEITNFGDRLNPWLWQQLLPGVFDEDETTAFVGIGTLLNNLLPQRLPKARKIAVFSSGFGYATGSTVIDDAWKIYCLRGPLSAQKLGVPAKLAVVDGAILVRRLCGPKDKAYRFAYMPHIHHALYGEAVWDLICEQIGFKYIAPYWPIEQVLSAISQTEILLAEAMHGAIVADALRIPWIPIRTSARVLTFKWQDWCSSVDVQYQPRYVTPLFSSYPRIARVLAARHWLNWLKQDKLRSLVHIGGDEQKLMATQLAWIAKNARPNLSDDHRIEQLTIELEARLNNFRTDVATGKL